MIVFDPSSPLQVDRAAPLSPLSLLVCDRSAGPANNLKRAKDEKYIFDRVYDAVRYHTDIPP